MIVDIVGVYVSLIFIYMLTISLMNHPEQEVKWWKYILELLFSPFIMIGIIEYVFGDIIKSILKYINNITE